MENFDTALKILLSYSWIVIGMTQLVKEALEERGIESKSLVRFIAILVGGAFGFFATTNLVGVVAGFVMGLITTGVVSYVDKKIDRVKSPAVILESPQLKVDNVEEVNVQNSNNTK
jgi:hypothetical protein